MKEIMTLMMRDKRTAVATVLCGMSIVAVVSGMWISLMGWRPVEYPTPRPLPFLVADKGEIVRLTPRAMAAQVYAFNKEMERRTRK